MLKKSLPILLVGLLALGLAGYFYRAITIRDDLGEQRTTIIHRPVWTVAQALSAAGVQLTTGDQIEPGLNQPVPWTGTIRIRRAVYLSLWENGQIRLLTALERIPAVLLAQHGMPLSPGDQLLWNGRPIDPQQPLPAGQAILLQLERAHTLTVQVGEQRKTITTRASSPARALWENGIRIGPGDLLSVPPGQPLVGQEILVYQPARPITIQVSGQTVQTHSAASTVGQALAEAGVALQGLDYASPPVEQALPADGNIRVVQVREEIVLNETLIPFESQSQPDPNLPLDQRAVTQPGQYGVQVARTRIRYEDEQEVARGVDSDWLASPPQPQIVGIGTQIVPLQLDTPSGPIEYYRAVPVYATSYAPCTGNSTCSWTTASGARLTKGIIAVRGSWYRLFAGQRVYVPGYGIAIIADVGGGIPGRYWIDLGFDEELFAEQQYTGWTTLYFLTPAPANVPWSLP